MKKTKRKQPHEYPKEEIMNRAGVDYFEWACKGIGKAWSRGLDNLFFSKLRKQ